MTFHHPSILRSFSLSLILCLSSVLSLSRPAKVIARGREKRRNARIEHDEKGREGEEMWISVVNRRNSALPAVGIWRGRDQKGYRGYRGYEGFPGRFSRSIAFPAVCGWKVLEGLPFHLFPLLPFTYPSLFRPCLQAAFAFCVTTLILSRSNFQSRKIFSKISVKFHFRKVTKRQGYNHKSQ